MIDDDRYGSGRLTSRLTLDEKALLLTGKTAWRTWAMPQAGLREMVFSDGPVGVRGAGENPVEVSDCLPSPTALAACWDLALAQRAGHWFAAQARSHGVDVVLAPVVNLQRSPVGGRHFECLSEDPLLTGDIAVALICGMQADGVAACVKHFVGNEVETDRTRYVSRISERVLREIYLAPFERAVAAGVWVVMAAYNQVEAGQETNAMVAHRYLLVDVLKGEWAFPGPVVSDWTAVTETVPSALGGLDLVMPGPHSAWSDGALSEAVRRGNVSLACLDDKVDRLFWLADKVGALSGSFRQVPPDKPADDALPRLMAAQACVVLTDQDDALPLADPSTIRSIALLGPNAADTCLLGGGSASVSINHPVSLADGLAQAFPQATITACPGVSSRVTPPKIDLACTRLPESGQPGVAVDFLDADGQAIAHQIYQIWTGTFGDEIPAGTVTIHLSTVLWLDEPGEHWIGVGTVGRHRVMIDGQVAAESDHEVGGESLINSSFNVPPARGMTVMVTTPRPVAVEAWVQCIVTQWGLRARAALHHRPPGPSENESIAQACQAAVAADLAIVVVGTNEETESEGWDRANLDLPGQQNDLVMAILGHRPDAIVLVNAGAPLVLPWLDQARTVVWMWFPGQAAGCALADILTGAQEPAGRLPWTLPDAHEHCPAPYGLPDECDVVAYDDGLHIGYRGWAKAGLRPARPFGFGLGWTKWQLEDARIAGRSDEQVTVVVRVRNVGRRTGADVVQAYLAGPKTSHDSLDRPVLWLAGHSRVQAEPGEVAETVITIDRRAFEVWQPADGKDSGRWVLPAGTYTIAIGHNALDLPWQAEITWE